jgi:hypothetical protein
MNSAGTPSTSSKTTVTRRGRSPSASTKPRNHAKLILIGRSRATGHEMLTVIAAEIESERRPSLADSDAYLLLGIRCRSSKSPLATIRTTSAMPAGFYRGKHFPHYQVAWPPNGLYPLEFPIL